MVTFLWGAHFYNTAHPGSDYDLVSVVLADIDNILSGITYHSGKQKRSIKWLGEKVDHTRYEVDHFLTLVGKGNIQLIELLMKYDPQYTFYTSKLWTEYHPAIKHYANKALNNTNWGHIRGWMHKTMNKVEVQGLTVKRAMLLWRMIIEARAWMNKNVFVCRWPDVIEHAPEGMEKLLTELYEARLSGRVFPERYFLEMEKLINDQVVVTLAEFDAFEPKKRYNMIVEKQTLVNAIRSEQVREKGQEYWFG